MAVDEKYAKSYDDDSLFKKVKKYANVIGGEILEKVFILYYVLIAPGTPTWAKALVMAALGYFISPIDAIPDIIPVLGYTDDAAILASSIVAVASYITPEIKTKAKEKTDSLLS